MTIAPLPPGFADLDMTATTLAPHVLTGAEAVFGVGRYFGFVLGVSVLIAWFGRKWFGTDSTCPVSPPNCSGFSAPLPCSAGSSTSSTKAGSDARVRCVVHGDWCRVSDVGDVPADRRAL